MSNDNKQIRALDDISLADKTLDDQVVKGVQAILHPLSATKPEAALYLLGCAFMAAQFAAREAGLTDADARLIAARANADGKRLRLGAPKLRNPNQELADTKAELEKVKAELAQLKK